MRMKEFQVSNLQFVKQPENSLTPKFQYGFKMERCSTNLLQFLEWLEDNSAIIHLNFTVPGNVMRLLTMSMTLLEN